MLSRDEIDEIIGILDDVIIELEEFCNDICNATSCYDCCVHNVIDKLADIIYLLSKRC